MNIQRQTLLTAIDRVAPATGDSRIEGADSIVFSDGWAHTYRDDMSISAPVPDLKDLRAAVKSKDLAKIVKKLKGDVIEIEKTETALRFTSGTTEGEIVLQPDVLSHSLASLALDSVEWSPVPEGLRTAIALCRLENQRDQFPVVHFTDNLVTAVTGFRWNFGTVDIDTPMPSFSMHTEAAKTLLTLGDLSQYAAGERWSHWQMENGAVFSALAQDAQFPMTKILGILNTLNQTEPLFQVPMPKDLADKVGIVATFANEDQKQGTPMVRVTVAGSEIRLESGNSGGKVKDKCKLESPLPEGVSATFEASVPYLEEASKKVQTMSIVMLRTTVKGEPVDAPRLLFRGEKFTQVVAVNTPD